MMGPQLLCATQKRRAKCLQTRRQVTLVFGYQCTSVEWASECFSPIPSIQNSARRSHLGINLLAVRDMMEELRASGVDTGGPPSFSQADRKAFANQLDTLLARAARLAAPKA